MVSAECEPIMGVWGHSPQWGQGAKALVRGTAEAPWSWAPFYIITTWGVGQFVLKYVFAEQKYRTIVAWPTLPPGSGSGYWEAICETACILIIIKHRDLLRLLHNSPEVPTGHTHTIVFTASLHWPPFSHGFGAQDTSSEIHTGHKLHETAVTSCIMVAIKRNILMLMTCRALSFYIDNAVTTQQVLLRIR